MITNLKRRHLYIFATILIFITVLIIIPLSYIVEEIGNKIYPMTKIDNIDMGKKTKDEAIETLNKKYNYLDTAMVEVIYKEQPIATFSAKQIDLSRDIKTKVDQAYIVGRTPNFPSRIMQQINSLLGIRGMNFYTSIDYDQKPIKEFLDITESTYSKPAKNALFKFE